MSNSVQAPVVPVEGPEVRTFGGLELRDVETDGHRYLEGRAVPYGVWQDVGWYMEQIRKGCFAKSIREAARRLPLLLFHDSKSFPIGVSERWREQDDGLGVVWRLDEAERAQEAARLAADGKMTGLSVGFAPIVSERTFDEDTGLSWVERIEARLMEVSLTPTPAYAGAQVSLVRSREPHVNREPSRGHALHVGDRRATRRSAEVDALRQYLEKIRR